MGAWRFNPQPEPETHIAEPETKILKPETKILSPNPKPCPPKPKLETPTLNPFSGLEAAEEPRTGEGFARGAAGRIYVYKNKIYVHTCIHFTKHEGARRC